MNSELETLITLSTDIYNSVGSGYNEVVYHRAFEVALRLNGINYESEVVTPIFYKGHNIGHGKVDIKLNNFIVELKAVSNFSSTEGVVQIKNYMKSYSINQGLVINFGQSNNKSSGKLDFKYILNNKVYILVNGTFVESEINI